MAPNGLIPELGPLCRDEQRRGDVLAHPDLNGIDYVEYERREGLGDDPDRHFLLVRLLKALPDIPSDEPDYAFGLASRPELIRLEGGRRIVGIEVVDVSVVDGHLEIEVDKAGDFSNYWLALGWSRRTDGSWQHIISALDPRLSLCRVNFRADCPVDFDCRQLQVCPPAPEIEPLIDYLAKDYASFRQLLLDFIPQLNPDWLERSPADLGIALVELLAYTGDHLSYFQDAVANEAYLDTALQRVSAKRHARLVDYRMHDGRNAWTFLHLSVGEGDSGTIPQHTKVLSRVTAPLRRQTAPPGLVISESDLPDDDWTGEPALSQVRAFETAFPLEVYRENNEIFIHSFGSLECCLPRGATSAQVYALEALDEDHQRAIRPKLNAGDYVLLEEVKGPVTGHPADADSAHRQVVQLVALEETTDPVYRDELLDGELQIADSGGSVLPLLQITWRQQDALTFPLCLSARPPGKNPILNISVARGNLILVDHGRTVLENFSLPIPVPPEEPFQLQLGQGPLTMQQQPQDVAYERDEITGRVRLETPRLDLSGTAGEAQPAVGLLVEFPTDSEIWTPVPHLLDSPVFAPHYVVDVDHEGRATLRFGDGEYGREPAGAIGFTVTYRVGNGRAGNVGAESLSHLVRPPAEIWPEVIRIRNPLPAQEGTDPETIEEVRQLAPAAFHAEQFRAVTEADYAAAARKLPEVAGAVATFRWTGSWYTVFVGVDPLNPTDLITEPGGRTRLTPEFEDRVRAFLTRYRLAGYDLEIRSGEYVPLEIDLEVCVNPGHFRGDVGEAVRQALSNRVNFDGTAGFFHPDNFTFGDAVYLSRLYAAVEAVEGVEAAVVSRFQRYGELAKGELEAGVIEMGPWEIARLDNDPNFMENGVLRIATRGGK